MGARTILRSTPPLPLPASGFFMFLRTSHLRAKDTPRAITTGIVLAAALIVAQAVPRVAWAQSSGDEDAGAAPPNYETVITDTPASVFESRVDEAASTSVITSSRTARSGETVPQLVSELPGVAVTRYGGLGALSTMSIRGSAPNQVQVYVDDVPLNLATGGGVDLGFIPVWGLERLEVFKGSSPIAFGSSGVGGVVAVQTHTPKENALTGSVGAGSWGSRNLSVSGAYAHPRVRTFVALSALGWKGDFPYLNDQATGFDPSDDVISSRINNDVSQQDGVMRMVFPLTGTRTITISASFDRRRQGVPSQGVFPAAQARLALDRQTAQVAYETQGTSPYNWRLRSNAYVLRVGQSFADLVPEISPRATHTDDEHWVVGSTSRFTKPISGWLELRGIVDLRHESYVPKDLVQDMALGAAGTRTYAAAGAEPVFWVRPAKLEIAPSARLEMSRDVLSVRNQFTQEPGALDPTLRLLPVFRLSLLQRAFDRVSFRGNIGRYVRAPSTTERYGNTGFVLPNPLLLPESGVNADVGARLTLGSGRTLLQTDAALFASRVKDLIQYQQNSQWQARAGNVSKAEIVGAELAMQLTWGRHFRTIGQVTFTEAKNASDVAARRGKQLPFRPQWRSYFRPELRDMALPSGLLAAVYMDADFTTGNYRDDANVSSVPRRLWFGAGASVAHTRSGVRVITSAINLANAAAMDFTGFPLPPRSFFVTLEWTSPLSSPASGSAAQGEI